MSGIMQDRLDRRIFMSRHPVDHGPNDSDLLVSQCVTRWEVPLRILFNPHELIKSHKHVLAKIASTQ
jgi:hypothetical protein